MKDSGIRVFWEIVPATSCNFCCLNCYAADNARPDVRLLDWNKMKIALDRAISLGIKHIYILGGESLTYSHLEKFIEYFKSQVKDSFCGVVSNGSLISKTRAKSLSDSGVDQLSISLDGTKAEINDANRGEGTFRQALLGIENTVNAKIPLTIAYTITPFNTIDTKNLLTFATKLGAQAVSIQITEPLGRAKRTLIGIKPFNRFEGLKAICKIYHQRPSIHTEISTRSMFIEFLNYFLNAGLRLKDLRCEGGLKTFMVSSGGDIYPCSEYAYFPDGNQRNRGINLVLDDINKIKKVIKDKYHKFNAKMKLLETKNFTTCRNCKYQFSCAPCPLANPVGIVPECEWVKLQTKRLTNKILRSKIKLLIPPKTSKGTGIRFSVPTQKQPLIIPLNEKKFKELFAFKSVSEIVKKYEAKEKKRKAGVYKNKIIGFLCKLRSHQVIEIQGFNSFGM